MTQHAHSQQQAVLPTTGALPENHTGGADESDQDERAFVRALKKQSHLEHDLKKLHLTHRYDTKQLRAKVPWYRYAPVCLLTRLLLPALVVNARLCIVCYGQQLVRARATILYRDLPGQGH